MGRSLGQDTNGFRLIQLGLTYASGNVMFFCFGSSRSGTTLISQSIGAHPDITVPAETDFIVPAAFVFDRIGDPATRRPILKALITQSSHFPWSLGEFLNAGEIRSIVDQNDTLPALLEAIYAAIAAKSGAKLAGDKSPNDLNFIRILDKTKALPADARVIHIVRDVRDVVAAIKARNLSAGLETQFARMWSASNLYLHTWMKGDPRYMLVRYEDFVSAPEQHLRALLNHLGHAFHPDTLDPEKRNPRLREHSAHNELYQPTTKARIGAYKEQLSPEDIARCLIQAQEGMTTFGYA